MPSTSNTIPLSWGAAWEFAFDGSRGANRRGTFLCDDEDILINALFTGRNLDLVNIDVCRCGKGQGDLRIPLGDSGHEMEDCMFAGRNDVNGGVVKERKQCLH